MTREKSVTVNGDDGFRFRSTHKLKSSAPAGRWDVTVHGNDTSGFEDEETTVFRVMRLEEIKLRVNPTKGETLGFRGFGSLKSGDLDLEQD
jgi:hypothetical protein